jgi:energy-coupling factor transporter transmembrane protein EcfT
MGMFLGMVGIFGFIVSLITLIVFLIAKKPLKKVLIALVVSFVLFSAGISMDTDTNTNDIANKNNASPVVAQTTEVAATKEEVNPQPKEVQTPPPSPKIYSFGFDSTEFSKRFNNSAKEFESNFRINNINIEDGTVYNTFQVMLNDNIGIIGTINKEDNSLREISALMRGDGTAQSGLDIMLTIGMLISVSNPDLLPDDRGNILKDLGLLDKNVDINNLDGSTIRNGIKYGIMSSQELGIMFFISNANEN